MNKKNVWKIIGVFIAIILMLYWLFAGTKIEEESDGIYTPEAIKLCLKVCLKFAQSQV